MALEVIPCPGHPGSVDLIVGDPAVIDPIHLSAAAWHEFINAVKAGKYDELGRP
jgi:hypothetical protein